MTFLQAGARRGAARHVHDRSWHLCSVQDAAPVRQKLETLPKVAAEMALHVLAYNLTCVMNIVGIKPLIAAIRA